MPFRDKGALLIHLDGTIAFASTYFCDLLGVAHDKIAGRSCLDFLFPEDTEAATKFFEASKVSKSTASRFRLRRIDGVEVWVEIQGMALCSPSGEIYAVSATATAARSAGN
jgi:PAS domain S-box-containing protein